MPDECNPPVNPTESTSLVLDGAERFQIAQAIYGAVTGKTEKLSRSYRKNYMIRQGDLAQLHAKCCQACTQWSVLQKSSNVTVHHIDDNKEEFSTFERFNIYDISKTAPVESVVYEFNILLALPNTPKPQNYKLTLRALSRVAIYKKMEEDDVPPGSFRFFSNSTLVLEIEYVDYVVARNLLSMIDSWAAEVEQIPSLGWVRMIQRYSEWIPPISQLVIIIVSMFALGKATFIALSATSTPPEMIKWLIFAGGGLWVSSIVARFIGGKIERSIDGIVEISAINLNKGDQRLIDQWATKNRWKFAQTLFGLILVVVQGFATDCLRAGLIWLFKK